jgi:hypothetical protein
MREDQIDQAERRETLDNGLKVLQQQGSTFYQHGLAQADETNQGRFAATGSPRVIGSTPTPAQYPAASAAHQTELPPEKPLGYSIDAMPVDEPSTTSPSVEATDDPADAPLSGSGSAPSGGSVSEPAGSSPSRQQDADQWRSNQRQRVRFIRIWNPPHLMLSSGDVNPVRWPMRSIHICAHHHQGPRGKSATARAFSTGLGQWPANDDSEVSAAMKGES